MMKQSMFQTLEARNSIPFSYNRSPMSFYKTIQCLLKKHSQVTIYYLIQWNSTQRAQKHLQTLTGLTIRLIPRPFSSKEMILSHVMCECVFICVFACVFKCAINMGLEACPWVCQGAETHLVFRLQKHGETPKRYTPALHKATLKNHNMQMRSLNIMFFHHCLSSVSEQFCRSPWHNTYSANKQDTSRTKDEPWSQQMQTTWQAHGMSSKNKYSL